MRNSYRIHVVVVGYVGFGVRRLVQRQMSLVSQSCTPQIVGRHYTIKHTKQNIFVNITLSYMIVIDILYLNPTPRDRLQLYGAHVFME